MGAYAAVAQGAFSILGAQSEAEDQRLFGEYQKQQFEANSRIAEIQAKDAVERGEKQANQLRQEGKKLRGAQRAAFAAQGIKINSGSAAIVQADSAATIEEDIVTVKNNAWREAWGFRAQALSSRNQGSQAVMAANNKANNTVLTGGIQAVGYGAQAYNASAKGRK